MSEQRLFAAALGVCSVQAVALHYVLLASPASIWLTTAVAGLTPLLTASTQLALDARTLVDCALDVASLLLPALVFWLCPCIGSVTMATLFRSLALVFNACLLRDWSRLAEAAALSGALFALGALRSTACAEPLGVGTAIGASALLLVATVCGVAFGMRQEARRTWRTTNALRAPLLVALIVATGGVPHDVPTHWLALYTALSVLAAHTVIAYNCAVEHRSYEMTRLLTVRRAFSATLGAVRLERFEASSAVLALGVVAVLVWRKK